MSSPSQKPIIEGISVSPKLRQDQKITSEVKNEGINDQWPILLLRVLQTIKKRLCKQAFISLSLSLSLSLSPSSLIVIHCWRQKHSVRKELQIRRSPEPKSIPELVRRGFSSSYCDQMVHGRGAENLCRRL